MSNFPAILFAVILIHSAALSADTKTTKDSPGGNAGKVTIVNVPLRPDCIPFEKEPILLKANTPSYPDSLINQDIRGKVIIDMLIGITGAIDRAEIRKGSGHVSLDSLALHSAYLFKFKPVISPSKKRVKVWVSYSFLFEAKKPGFPPARE
jgi:TonB family protein